MPLGLLLIVLGWYGSAQTVLPFEQMPFLISGGVLGSALVTGGGFLYFAYWLTVGVREDRAERVTTRLHHERVESLLTLLTQHLTHPGEESRTVVTSEGTMLHRADCAVTVGQAVTEAPFGPELAICGICRPQPTAAPTATTRPKVRR